MKTFIYNSSWLAHWPVFFSQLKYVGDREKPVTYWLAELLSSSAYLLVLFFHKNDKENVETKHQIQGYHRAT